MRCCHTERLRKWNCSRYMYGVNLSDVTFAITITQNERCLYGPTLIKRAKTRKHCGRMPTTHLLTVHASYWTSLNMFGGFLYSAFQVEKKFEYVLGVGGGGNARALHSEDPLWTEWQTDRHDWKYYLPATLLVRTNNNSCIAHSPLYCMKRSVGR